MSKQIFKSPIPKEILFELLDKICEKTVSQYMIHLDTYKKMKYHGYQTEFLSKIKDYYHLSKRFYIERDFTYNSFTNIIRQICRSNEIPIESIIKYRESTYTIEYLVSFV